MRRERNCKNSYVVILSVLLSVLPGSLWAQGSGGRGSISGTVLDPSGAVLPGVSVTALNTATGFNESVTTSSSGTYVIPLLQVGPYTLTFQKDGFQTASRTGLVLVADESASENVTLAVGSSVQKVTVSASAVELDTQSAALTSTIGATAIEELPLNGRNPASLVLLTPGMNDVLGTSASMLQTFTTHPNETGASANGGRQGSTYYMLDGSNNMDPYLLLSAPFPNADATQEFSVIGNNFDAQYGFSPGAVVSIVTKSGTNEWHGNVFEFLRNDALNATDYFTHAKDALKRNQFGGSLGGAVVKDKLFIFGNYQETLAAIANNSTSSFTPTTSMRNGDFSAICRSGFDASGICKDRGGAGNVIDQIWQDPSFTVPFQGNIIPSSRLNAGSLALLQFIPVGGNPVTGQSPLAGASIHPNDYQFTIRADYNPNEKHRFSGHVFRDSFRQAAVTGGGNLLLNSSSWDTNYGNYEGTYTWAIRPSILNQAAFSYGRQYSTSQSGQVDSKGNAICLSRFWPAIKEPGGRNCAIEGLPLFGVVNQNSSWYHRYVANFTDSLTLSKGKHLIVAGIDTQRIQMAPPSSYLTGAIINPDGSWTGNPWSDFLLGQTSYYLQGAGENGLYTGTQLGLYAQDRIQLTPTFTLSAGLRYEPFLPPVAYHGRAAYFRPGQQSTRYPNAPLGMVFPGDKGIPAGGVSNQNYFDPRIGLAWAPGFLPHTSIRSAFGLFTAPIDYSHYTHQGDNSPFTPVYFFTYLDPGVGSINLNNPWANYAPTGGVSPFPPFAAIGPGLPQGLPPSNVAFPLPVSFAQTTQKNFNLGQTASWNVSIEHQVKSTWLFRAAYVGSESWKQGLLVEQNPGINNVRALANFGSIVQNNSVGTASYQAGQIVVEKTLSAGLQFGADYTWSKTIDESSADSDAFFGSVRDPFNIRFNRGISDLNAPKILSVNWVYKTPTLREMKPLVRGALGSWELTGIWHAQSGVPFSIYAGPGFNNSGSLVFADLADRVPGQPLNQHGGGRSHWLSSYFNTAAFEPNAMGTFGDSGRNILTGPGVNNFDLGLMKNVPFRESRNVQFRWEMFNAFNHVMWALPDNTLSDPSFGMISSTNAAHPARVMQAALKFTY